MHISNIQNGFHGQLSCNDDYRSYMYCYTYLSEVAIFHVLGLVLEPCVLKHEGENNKKMIQWIIGKIVRLLRKSKEGKKLRWMVEASEKSKIVPQEIISQKQIAK